jgi:hypothetical protein
MRGSWVQTPPGIFSFKTYVLKIYNLDLETKNGYHILLDYKGFKSNKINLNSAIQSHGAHLYKIIGLSIKIEKTIFNLIKL